MAAGAIEGEKAQRIVDAMRVVVTRKGVTGATFDAVAREAGVSRGLLHYYFGSKERLLVEVVRRECEVRQVLLRERLAGAGTAEEVLEGLVRELETLVREDPGFMVLVFELFTVSRRNAELAAEFAELMRLVRGSLASLLAAKQGEGAVELHAEPEAIADVLFGMADGIALRMIAEPERDWAPAIAAGVTAVRALLR
jgi:AcrR family transcriptional regulator